MICKDVKLLQDLRKISVSQFKQGFFPPGRFYAYVMDGEEASAIILDTGTDTTKAGFCREESPNVMFPTLSGSLKQSSQAGAKAPEASEDKTFVGKDEEEYDEATIQFPMHRGIVTNWDIIEQIWYHTFHKFCIIKLGKRAIK
ncbi:hypothetical protein RFI_24016 [Reticulomyxa filosa]|uniref:Actin n=1 Tax=Reticulomyxa filosa TaxID=46433 RepID=X6MJZ5_RETFI|nr:hypothetical protein RFI_24016 [Reticulomyxa filosa]|eukprot:ETO13360.1 hypothetical protein RFI_24016 [Reticulomyxa filosa]